MFCSKCGKTLSSDSGGHCSCGQAIGDSRFEGVPYTSAQARIVPGESSYSASDPLPYTRTTYTGRDEQIQASVDVDARTTYRPVYEGSSVPEGIRRDVRAAVGHDETEEMDDSRFEDNPLIREIFHDDTNIGIDDFDLSQIRSRPIVSEGRAGISRDVTEYVERLEAASERGVSRSRRRRIYGDAEASQDQISYEEVGEEVFADAMEDGEEDGYASRNIPRLVIKIASIVVIAVLLFVGGKLIYDKVNDIQTNKAPIEGVSLALYEQGLEMIKAHADTAYVDSLLTTAEGTGVLGITTPLSEDAAEITALLSAEPNTNDELFVSVLSSIQVNIGNSVTMDVIDMNNTDTGTAIANSQERWNVVNGAITQLEAATNYADLTAILGGKTILIAQPTNAPTPTPVPYKTLSKGDKSEDVLALQNRLWELGYLQDDRDGAFGNKTQTAIKQFQSEMALEVTGIADAVTQNALYSDDAIRTDKAQPTVAATLQPTIEPTPEPAPEAADADADADVLAGEPTLLR